MAGYPPYQHSPGIGTLPSRAPYPPYQHSPGMGTVPALPVRRPTPSAIPRPQLPGALAPPVFQMPDMNIDTSSFGAQAAAEAQRQIDPILQMITQRSNAQAAYSQQAISALTASYADRLSGLVGEFEQSYAPAIQQSKALAKGSGSLLRDAGKSAAGTEGKATGLQGKSAGSDVDLAAEGAGAGNAAQIIQDGMTQALKTAQSAAMKYAGSLPGFAQKEGQMATVDVLKQIASSMAQQLAETTAQAPIIYHQIYNELLDRAENDRNFQLEVAKLKYQTDADNYDRTVAAQDRAQAQRDAKAKIMGPNAPTTAGRKAYWDQVAAQRTEETGQIWVGTTTGIRPTGKETLKGAAARQAGIKVDQGQQKIDMTAAENERKHQETMQKIAIQRQNARTAEQRAAVAAAAQAETERNNKWKNQHPNAKTPAVKKPTPNQVNTMVDSWYTGKQTTRKAEQPKLDKNGNPVYKTVQGPRTGQLSYQQALQRLKAMNMTDQEARQILNTRWKRGERGRPWLGAPQRQALAKGNAASTAHYYKGHAYLDRGQFNLLKLDNLLPDGEWVNGRYYIKPTYA